MSKFLGSIKLWSDGSVMFDATWDKLTLHELEVAFRATVGAEAAAGEIDPAAVRRLAASLLARAGAEKARAIRAEAGAA